jgi:hypothetical protein
MMFAMIAAPAAARAGCGASTCPLDSAGTAEQQAGEVRFSYQWEYLDQDEYRLGRHSAGFGQVRGHHDEMFTRTHIQRMGAAVGVTDRFSLEAQLPVVSRDHAHVHHHQGADFTDTWEISGFGDVALLGRYTFRKPQDPTQPTLTATLGGELPTGDHHKDSADDVEAEPGVQPGSNSLDLITGLATLQTFSAPTLTGEHAELPVFTSVQAKFNGHGTDEYRLGDAFTFSAGASYPLTRRLGLTGQVNVLVRDRDDRGRTFEEMQKTGGEFVYLSPGVEWRASPDWRAYAMVQLPVYQRVNSLQLVSDFNVIAGVEYRFQLWGERRGMSHAKITR